MISLRAFFICLCIVPTLSWAARTPLSVISGDPYVSALVLEADSGKVLFNENANAKVYPASVLKLMDLYVILDRIEHGTLRLDDMVQVTAEASKTGGSQVYLDPKEQFSVDDLLYALMVQSANDAAVALAIHVAGSKEGFVALMNQKAQELGMKSTHFNSVHGLPPSEGQEPDVTTASDFGILCRALAKKPETFKYTGTQSRGFREDKFIMRNHNKLLTQVGGCDGFKTGYFEAAGFSIAVQLYAVVGMSLLATFGLYHFMQWHIRRDTKFMGIIRRLGYKTHISRTGIFFWLQLRIKRAALSALSL